MEAVLEHGLPKTGLEDGNVGKALKAAGILPAGNDRIKSHYQHGIPKMGNDIIAAHTCTPQILHDIFDQNHIELLARYSAVLDKQSLMLLDGGELGVHIPKGFDFKSVYESQLHIPSGDSVTICITSCNRHDLLRRTLQSLSKCVIDMPIKETVIIEDSEAKKPDWLLEYRTLGLGEIRWIANGKRIGQWMSIDKMYETVTTELIFHCEDDWEFDGRPFMAASAAILKSYPGTILQVSLRGDDNTSGHPNVDAMEGAFKVQEPYWRQHWGGYSGNPGLRRKSDWERLGSYGRATGYGRGGIVPEQILSKTYLDAGYRIAVLPTDKPFIKHIGERRSKAAEPLAKKPKVLIAVPACWRYTYGSHANDLPIGARQTEGRVEAVRSTWWNDIKPFGDYVDAKFFYGIAPMGMVRKPLPDEVFLNIPDDYEHLPLKMHAIYKWALQHGYDYVFKADDDGYLYVDRLMRVEFEKWDQMGFSNCAHGLAQSCGCYVTGGAGYFLSKRALQAVTSTPLNAVSPHKWAEDWQTGQVLRAKRMRRSGHPGFLPGFDKHYVDVDEVLKSDKQYVALHAVTPEGMHKLYGK